MKVGDRVRNIAADIVGTVVEIDGDTVYLEQDNGVEVDFPAARLVREDAYQAKHAAAAPVAADPAHEALVAALYPAVLEIGRQYHDAVRPPPGVARRGWDDLGPLQKLNAVSEATGIPVKDWLDANRPGARPGIGPFQLSVLSARSGKK